MTQNSNKINFWRGTRFVFERKIQRNELIVGTVYFVGNSMEDVEGTGQSTYGVIYQAVSENRAVRYGIFATDDDITRLIEELTEKIDEEGEERREADDQLSERIAHLIPEVADAVENHMAIFDSDGRLKDSGRDIVEFLMDGDIDDATIKFENGKLVVQDYSHKHHIPDVDGLRGELDTKIGTEKMGTSNGIATLDENAKVNLEQMPYTDGYGIDITSAGEIKTEPITDAEIDAMNAGERNGHLLDNLGLVRLWNRIVSFFVQKEEGKGLSSNDYTDSEKNKLAGIEQGAEVNVQSDWNQTDTSADDYIKNKPSVYTKTEVDNKLTDKQDALTLPLSIANGGTGATNTKSARLNLLSDATVGTSDVDDGNYFVFRYQTPSSDNGTIYYRTASRVWNWIQGKTDARYQQNLWINEILYGYPKVTFNGHINDLFYALSARATVTWKTYNKSDDTLVSDNASDVYKLFGTSSENTFLKHITSNQYSIIEMEFPSALIWTKGTRIILLSFYYQAYPAEAPLVSYYTSQSPTTEVSATGTKLTNFQYSYSIAAAIKKLVIRIDGNPNFTDIVLSRILAITTRADMQFESAVTKHAIPQDLYGNVTAPSFIKRGGTSQQVLLANGTTINMPSTTGTNKDTLLKNLVSGLVQAATTSELTDTTEIITSFAGNNGFNTSAAINVAYKRPVTKIWNYIKSKADLVYSTITETNKKTNRIIDHTWNQPSYSASASGTHVKICDIPSDCVCIMNVRKSVYGYPSINTLWIGNHNSLDFKSLTETDIVATVSSRVCTLSVPAHTASGTPLHTYDFEISVLNKDDLSAITWYDTATYYSPSRPTKPNVVMQQSAPVTDGSLAFNVNSSTHVASVSVDGYTDFVGMLTEDSESAVLVKLSDEAEGSVYRFTFDHAIEGGVSFSNSNASTVYCEVSQDIHAGDTITLTAVSNTADGWIASVSSAGIISSDNSVNIEWENGVADLKVEGIPFNNIVNNAMFQEGDSPYPLAVGSGAVSLLKSGDEDYPFILTKSAKLVAFKVDDSTTNVYSYFVNGGTTYSLNVSGTIISYTPSTNKYIYIIDPSTMYASEKIVAGQYWYIDGTRYMTNEVVKSGSYYVVGSQNIPGGMNSSTIVDATIYKNGIVSNGYPQALGLNCEAKGEASTAVGIQAKSLGSWSVAIGNNAYALGYNGIAIGSNSKACGDFSILIGNQASTIGNSTLAIGYYARVKGLYSVALGNNSKAYSEKSVAIGNYSATALERAIAVGDNAYAGYDSNDADYPKYLVKRFTAIDFTENGVTKKVRWVGSNDEVTIVLNGNTITLSAPNNNSKFFIIVNDSLAVRIGKPITGYAKINGVETYCNIGGYNVTPVAVNGNVYYALWMYSTQSYFQNTIDSFSFLAYYKATYSQGYMFAFGYSAVATNTNAIAFGNETRAIRDRQIVIGSGNLPDENALFIIGGGNQTANSRKNILTIDDKEIVHARAYVSDAVTYELNGDNVALGTITMGLLKVTGGGTLTLTSTNAVEGHCVKVYASGSDITCNGDSITAGRWREYLFIDGAWRSKM